jgi:hypothetical protein
MTCSPSTGASGTFNAEGFLSLSDKPAGRGLSSSFAWEHDLAEEYPGQSQDEGSL